MNFLYRSRVLISALALFTSISVTASWSLSFPDVVAGLEKSTTVQTAILDLRTVEQQRSIALFPGDIDVSVTPSVAAVSQEGGAFAEQTELSAALSVLIPIGLSTERRIAVESSQDALIRAENDLVSARADAYLTLFRFYRTAWLAQRETEVLQTELDAAREQARVVRQLFERGEASVLDLNSAEDDLNTAETAVIAGTLAKRISWLELAYFAQLNPNEEVVLEPISDRFSELPRPPDLTEWANEHSPVVAQYRDQITAYNREIGAIRETVLPPTFRTTFAGWDQTASVSFSAANPAVGLNYTVPITTFGSDPGGSASSNADTWQVGVSVTLPLRAGESGQLERTSLLTKISQMETQLRLIQDTIALQIRSRYQQYVLSNDSVDQALRAIGLTQMTLDTIVTRRENQQATLSEELLARAQLARSQFRYDSAVSNRQETKLLTAQAASYLDQMIHQ